MGKHEKQGFWEGKGRIGRFGAKKLCQVAPTPPPPLLLQENLLLNKRPQ